MEWYQKNNEESLAEDHDYQKSRALSIARLEREVQWRTRLVKHEEEYVENCEHRVKDCKVALKKKIEVVERLRESDESLRAAIRSFMSLPLVMACSSGSSQSSDSKKQLQQKRPAQGDVHHVQPDN